MSDYVRPLLPRRVFYDSDGTVIDYGNRWRGGSPPEDSYSVVSNLQRYAPLYQIADALIEHLARNYAVEVSEDLAFADDVLASFENVARAVRAVPMNNDEAPLTFVFTSFPGIAVHAGMLKDFVFPSCGCDACDESLERIADELEWTVLAVAAGGFSEQVGSYTLSAADGTRRRAGTSTPFNVPPDRLEAARERLGRLPDGWQAWTQQSRELQSP